MDAYAVHRVRGSEGPGHCARYASFGLLARAAGTKMAYGQRRWRSPPRKSDPGGAPQVHCLSPLVVPGCLGSFMLSGRPLRVAGLTVGSREKAVARRSQGVVNPRISCAVSSGMSSWGQ
jgi:hypothetical protein